MAANPEINVHPSSATYGEESGRTRRVDNQPYDETLEVSDPEDIPSNYSSPNPGARPQYSTAGRTMEPEAEKAARSHEDEHAAGAMTGDSAQNLSSDDDEDEGGGVAFEGGYDPTEYENLSVGPEIRELFQHITSFVPQNLQLEYKLKPFIPDYIPAVGDIDGFIKVERPDGAQEHQGLSVLDEPCARQSDPTVLDLQLRRLTKAQHTKQVTVHSIQDPDKDVRAVDNWVESISDLHRMKPPPTVHFSRNMPDIESLMQEWPANFEALLGQVALPSADLDCTLQEYVDLICGLLDIPVYKSRVQSLYVLFSLYSEFKNSQHFKNLAQGRSAQPAQDGDNQET